MKKIVYFNRARITGRVFASLKERSDMSQTIITPYAMNNMANKNYDNFGIKNIKTYDGRIESAQKILDTIKPNILVQTELPERVCAPYAKRVFVNHGIMHKSSNLPFKQGEANVHRRFDLYCGETKFFGDFIDHIFGGNCNILYNALPQLDLLNSKYCTSYKNKFLSKINFIPKLVILFCVSCCKDIVKFTGHNEDYFETIFELNKLAMKNNWLIIVKPRYSNDKMVRSASKIKRLRLYVSQYKQMLKVNNKHIVFLDHEDDIYRYMFADVILLNGTSTFEVESVLAKKPTVLTRINKRDSNYYDPFGSINHGAVQCVRNINELEESLVKPRDENKQKKFIDWYGIKLDGLAHKRLQDAMLKL